MIKTAFSIKKDQPRRGRSDSERAGVYGFTSGKKPYYVVLNRFNRVDVCESNGLTVVEQWPK